VVAPPETTANVTFDKTMDDRIGEVMRRYPTRRAALLPSSGSARNVSAGSPGVISAVAERLGDSPAFVDGVVSFYTMLPHSPPARYVAAGLHDALVFGLRWTRTRRTPQGQARRRLRREDPRRIVPAGGRAVPGRLRQRPVIQVNDDYYENLTPQRLDAMLDELREGR